MSDKTPSTVVALPLSLTDLAKAIREIIGLTKDVAESFERFGKARTRRKFRNASMSLGVLRFAPGRLRSSLRDLADGAVTDERMSEMKAQLRFSGADVDEAIRSLQKYQPLIEAELGFPAVDKLYEVVNNAVFGKMILRRRINQLSAFNTGDDSIPVLAAKLLEDIEEFNKSLYELHDLVLVQSKP